jgi:KUP system potassium uptake protein
MMDGEVAHRTKAGAPPGADRPITAAAALAALGIVYGDLGTSPLYTYETIVDSVGGHPSATAAMGLLSLVVWTLIITVSIKYCVFVMRADNHGEGGILALMSLVTSRFGGRGRTAAALVAMGLFGAALIYGDGVITPAISVLSALEGVNVVTKAFTPYVVPAALVILLVLFAAQTRGTAAIGRLFGPVMLAWFVVIAILGIRGILRRPEVIGAVSPTYAIGFLAAHGWQSFIVLGGVFLAITGGEALYADMGHIGRQPIRAAWYAVVLPDGAAGRQSRPERQPLLPAGAALGHRAARGAGDARHHHREPGHHHRRLLADPPGDATRLASRPHHPPDLG